MNTFSHNNKPNEVIKSFITVYSDLCEQYSKYCAQDILFYRLRAINFVEDDILTSDKEKNNSHNHKNHMFYNSDVLNMDGVINSESVEPPLDEYDLTLDNIVIGNIMESLLSNDTLSYYSAHLGIDIIKFLESPTHSIKPYFGNNALLVNTFSNPRDIILSLLSIMGYEIEDVNIDLLITSLAEIIERRKQNANTL